MATFIIGAGVGTRNGGPTAVANLCESFMYFFDTAGNLFFARLATTSSAVLARSRES